MPISRNSTLHPVSRCQKFTAIGNSQTKGDARTVFPDQADALAGECRAARVRHVMAMFRLAPRRDEEFDGIACWDVVPPCSRHRRRGWRRFAAVACIAARGSSLPYTAMGIDWITTAELSNAIYAKFIAEACCISANLSLCRNGR